MKKDEVIEVLVLLFLCFAQLWWLETPVILPFIFLLVGVSFLTREEPWPNFGLGNIQQTVLVLGIFVSLYLINRVEILSGWRAEINYLPKKILHGYFWALGQQIILNSYLTNRVYALSGQKFLPTILVVGTIFSLAHLPNPFLVLATWPGGIIMSAIFLKRKNLYELALLHLVVSTTLYLMVSPDIHHHFVVGCRFYK
jgi:membrane protease YdiL (CAAX protease family)